MSKVSEQSGIRPGADGGAAVAFRRAPAAASWDERCAVLFDDLRKPARVMIARAFGRTICADEVEDIYANAWTSTLSALRGRAERMSDEDLRSYLLTAVANHAAKEMRRRRRRPTSELSDAHAQVLADSHQPSPEERAVGTETGSLARDVLSSLPRRRRAVILLRYGWGLDPKEICSLINGLSPRAYRKEITRGIGEMIERLGQAESGEWCRSREPLIRDYVAGTADQETEQQASKHLGHCRHCSELVGRLTGALHDLGSGFGWTAAVGVVGERRLAIGERAGDVLDRGREAGQALAGRGEEATEVATAVATSGGARGAGALGAGAFAKLAGLGVAGKATLACLGAGVAATACVATGVVEPPGKAGSGSGREQAERSARTVKLNGRELTPTPSVDHVGVEVVGATPGAGAGGGGGNAGDQSSGADGKKAPEPEPAATVAPEPAPAPSAGQAEFGLGGTGGTTVSSPAPSGSSGGSGTSGGSGGSTSGGSGGSGAASKEFGGP